MPDMSEEETRQQVHEIRNLLGRLNLEVRDLTKQIAEVRIALEHRLERIELAIKLPPESVRKELLPAHEDKGSPPGIPPQPPA
jgi:hypothetical protein